MKSFIDKINEDVKTLTHTGAVSDGYHTFDQLYHQRAILFSIICKAFHKNAWKSRLHADGTMYTDYFIVGITTEKGDFTYHYHKDYWALFPVKNLERAPEWDGHTEEDVDRLFSLFWEEEEKEK